MKVELHGVDVTGLVIKLLEGSITREEYVATLDRVKDSTSV